MVAGGTNFGRSSTFVDISTDETLPFDRGVAFPYSAGFYLVEVFLEACGMAFFNGCNGGEVVGYFLEAFLFCHFCEFEVHCNTFFCFFINRGLKVFGSGANHTAISCNGYGYGTTLKVFEIYFGMVELVIGSFRENLFDGEIVFFLCLFSIEDIS